MSTIVTRSGKGSPLSHVEVDANFTNLNTDKIQSGNTVAALTITALTTPSVQAVNSAGLALKNSAGTTQISMGAGGGDNITVSAPIAITPANGLVNISPTGTGTVTINPATAGTINNMSIGATTASTGAFTSLTYTGTLTGGTGIVNLGSGQFYKDASGNVGIGKTPSGFTGGKLDVAGFGYFNFNATDEYVRVGATSGGTAEIYRNAGDLGYTVETSYNHKWYTGGTERMRIASTGDVGVGTTNPVNKFVVSNGGAAGFEINPADGTGVAQYAYNRSTSAWANAVYYANQQIFAINGTTEAMRIDFNGALLVGTTSAAISNNGLKYEGSNGALLVTRTSSTPFAINRLTNDGNLIEFYQDTSLEGSISVSGTTVSYNGGHLSRWSQWQNQTGKPEVYRGSVLESTNDMCEWNQANEQTTKTIVSTTAKSKAVAGVFDMYDTDDKDSPYDFYVAQSGDFVIRIAQGVVVENGDLLESAGDGTARPQTDDICRSSTVAKVTSNYVSITYADGSYCVPCILMIG